MKKLRKGFTVSEYAELSATKVAFTGGRVIGNRIIPDKGYYLEKSKEEGVVFLKKDDDATIILRFKCDCGLEGGTCEARIGDPNEWSWCHPERGCGTSGLFCFLEADTGDMKFYIKM